MTSAQIIWAVLIAAFAVVNLPLLFHLLKGQTPMAVDPRVQTALDEINASVAALPAKLAEAAASGNAQAAQDATDTAAAVQAAADALKTAVGA